MLQIDVDETVVCKWFKLFESLLRKFFFFKENFFSILSNLIVSYCFREDIFYLAIINTLPAFPFITRSTPDFSVL